MSARPWAWALAALLGIVLTAAITWATSQLTSQRIGLSSEPVSAGGRLAPAEGGAGTSGGAGANGQGATTTHTSTRTRSSTTTTLTVTTVLPVGTAPRATPAPVAPVGGASGSSTPSKPSGQTRDDGGGEARSGGGRDD